MIVPSQTESLKVFTKRFDDWVSGKSAGFQDQFLRGSEQEKMELQVWARKIWMKHKNTRNSERSQDLDGTMQRPLLVRDNQIYMYGSIGDWYDEIGFENTLQALDRVDSSKPVTIRLNSSGGEVSEGQVIIRLMQEYGRSAELITVVDGKAYSMAAFAFMVGRQRLMGSGTNLMVHRPWAVTIGTADDLRKQADVLDGMSDYAAELVSANSDLELVEALAMINDETYLKPAEAIDNGMATGMDQGGPGELDGEQNKQLRRKGYEPKASIAGNREAVKELKDLAKKLNISLKI